MKYLWKQPHILKQCFARVLMDGTDPLQWLNVSREMNANFMQIMLCYSSLQCNVEVIECIFVGSGVKNVAFFCNMLEMLFLT